MEPYAPIWSRRWERLLLGPGPTNSDPRVRAAAALPLVGHLDPEFGSLLDELQQGLRQLFGTENPITFAVSGTGTAGMEFLAVNLVESGDRVAIGVNGVFGGRIAELCEKLGAEVVRVERPWGQPLGVDDFERAVAGAVTSVWVVLAETSTGVRQTEVAELAAWAHARGGLMILDTVTALGGIPVELDAWGVDAAFAGTQKCLGVTPGLAPVSVGERALARFRARRTPVPSWYFDLEKLLGYWAARDGRRVYHHTAPIAALYALHEAVRLILVEGVAAVHARHAAAGARLEAALEARGFRYVVADPGARLPQLHCVRPPDGIDEAWLRRELLASGIEIGAGLGAFAGEAVRIGLMGPNACDAAIDRLLGAFDRLGVG